MELLTRKKLTESSILIVDSSEEFKIIKDYILEIGRSRFIIHASNASSALNKMHKQKFSVIFLNSSISKKEELVRLMNKNEEGVSDKTIVLLDKAEKEIIDLFYSVGVKNFIVKPYDKRIILEKISKVMNLEV